MSSKFTERDTEDFYDAEDAIYRSFWDKEGSLHWGLFDQSTGTDFPKACANLNEIMAQKALIDSGSTVLDLGCGNGATSAWLCTSRGCRVVGIDLSGVRIGNAREALQTQPEDGDAGQHVRPRGVAIPAATPGNPAAGETGWGVASSAGPWLRSDGCAPG